MTYEIAEEMLEPRLQVRCLGSGEGEGKGFFYLSCLLQRYVYARSSQMPENCASGVGIMQV